jgi:hypothetical protein
MAFHPGSASSFFLVIYFLPYGNDLSLSMILSSAQMFVHRSISYAACTLLACVIPGESQVLTIPIILINLLDIGAIQK